MPHVTLSQVGVHSIILDQLLQVTLTSYGTLAFIIFISTDYEQNVQKQMIEDIKSVDQKSENQNSEKSESPKRGENFITGHRIPLELFSSETLRRIELIPEQTTVQVCNKNLTGPV